VVTTPNSPARFLDSTWCPLGDATGGPVSGRADVVVSLAKSRLPSGITVLGDEGVDANTPGAEVVESTRTRSQCLERRPTSIFSLDNLVTSCLRSSTTPSTSGRHSSNTWKAFSKV
jgi:hypothetical protein